MYTYAGLSTNSSVLYKIEKKWLTVPKNVCQYLMSVMRVSLYKTLALVGKDDNWQLQHKGITPKL